MSGESVIRHKTALFSTTTVSVCCLVILHVHTAHQLRNKSKFCSIHGMSAAPELLLLVFCQLKPRCV